MRFKIVDCGTDNVVHGFEGLSLDHAYIASYPSIKGKLPKDLAVGEHTVATYNLSMDKPTAYWIVRTE